MKGQTLALAGALVMTLGGFGGGPVVAAEMTVAQEQAFGAREHLLIIRRFGGEYADPDLRQYVAETGERLVQALGASEFTFTFTLLDSPDTHAFAVPGGYVYITRQMLAIVNSEAELAAVLAHEMAHIIGRHANQRGLMLDRLQAAAFAADVDAMHQFTQEQEFTADTAGVRLLAAAGYDPMAQARFLVTVGGHVELAERTGTPRPGDPATHPTIAERARRAAEAAREVEQGERDKAEAAFVAGYLPGVPARRDWIVDRDRYLGAIDGMVYGRRPSEGMVFGNTYVDTAGRFAFTLPPGFRFTSIGRGIMAEGPNGATMRFEIQATRSPQTESVATYLGRSIGSGFAVQRIDEETVNTMQAAFAQTALAGPDGHVAFVQYAAVRATPTAYFRFQFYVPGPLSADMADKVWSAPRSLVRLTETEARVVQPMRIEVLTAEPGLEVEAVAARMRMVDRPLEWLLMLNQLKPGTVLAPGAKLKIIAE